MIFQLQIDYVVPIYRFTRKSKIILKRAHGQFCITIRVTFETTQILDLYFSHSL